MQTITIPDQEKVINVLKRANYEVSGRQQIINFMIANNMRNHDSFKEYWQEYLDYLMAYEVLKDKFEKEYIIPAVGENAAKKWEVDFITDEIRLYN